MTDAPRRPAAALSGGPRSAVAVLLVLAATLAAGCNATAPPTSAPATATSALPSSAATASVSAAPSASAKVDPATAAIDRFVALVTKDGFSYQATFSGQSRHTTDIFPISDGLLQVSGADVLVRATWSNGSRHEAVEHRYVAEKAWIKYGSTDTWHRLTFQPAESMAAFAAIRSRTDVTYLGPAPAGAGTAYKVSFRSAIVNPVMIPAGNLTDTVVTSPKLVLLIDATGRPISGTATIVGQGRVSGQLQEIIIDLDVTFTKVGAAVSIKAP